MILGVIVGLLVLTLVVVIHELGHGIVARRNSVKVEEFGVGFPPRAWGKKVKKSVLGENVEYTVNWLPLGGFVRLRGEHDSSSGKGHYGEASLWAKTKILLAGVAMNWMTAFVVLTVLSITGMPKVLDNQYKTAAVVEKAQPVRITHVAKDSPAERAGIVEGDSFLAINGQGAGSLADVQKYLKSLAGKQVGITLLHEGKEKNVDVKLRAPSEGGALGVGLDERTMHYAGWSAPINGLGLTMQLTELTFKGVGDTLVALSKGVVQKIIPTAESQANANKNLKTAGDNVAGPVGLVGTIMPAILKQGGTYVLLMIAIISIGLAVMNVLPIPALDGGRLFVTLLYRYILRRPLTAEAEDAIHGRGMLVLLGLFVIITISDVMKFF